MKVNHVNDHVTHVVVGGHQTIDFGISDDPAFFQILSSTLYTNQPLAVVREVLCNSWDAHIEAGKTDVPVKVTVEHDKIVFRDFGKGIKHELIGPIYGVYGKSTKVSNGAVTGGFGLGCKAPFAYTDHFQVTSMHDGIRTIYNMSKSSAEAEGKPGIVPIASFPTEDSGIEVTIQLKSRHDSNVFQNLVHQIARNGEMLVEINCSIVETIPFSTMEHNFMITDNEIGVDGGDHFYLRYGNVIYPIPHHKNYSNQWNDISNFLNIFGTSWSGRGTHKIIFQAEPNTISVTPSRESLSMQERTIETVTNLFDAFLDIKKKSLTKLIDEELTQSIDKAYLLGSPSDLLDKKEKVPLIGKDFEKSHFVTGYLTSFPAITRRFMRSQYPGSHNPAFRRKDLTKRLDALVQAGFDTSGLVNSFRREYTRTERKPKCIRARGGASYNRGYDRELITWVHRKIFFPMIQALTDSPDMNQKNIHVYEKDLNSYLDTPGFKDPKSIRFNQYDEVLPYLRNIVVLSHNRADVGDRVHQFPIMKHWLGKDAGYLVYIVPRNTKRIDQAREFFRKRGVNLIDLTIAQKWEHASVALPISKVGPAKAKPAGLIKLSEVLRGATGHSNMKLNRPYEMDEPERIEKPKYVVKISSRKKDNESFHAIERYGSFREANTMRIIRMFGAETGMVSSDTQLEAYIKRGAISLLPHVTKLVQDTMKTDTVLREHMSISALKEDRYGTAVSRLGVAASERTLEWYQTILGSDQLASEFGVTPVKLTKDQENILELWKEMTGYNSCRFIDHKETETVKKEIDNLPVPKQIIDLITQLEGSKFLKLFSRTRIHLMLRDQHTCDVDKRSVLDLIQLAL